MMGQQSGLQERLFYQFRLDDWVALDHLLRKIDAALDLSSLRHELAPFYSGTGRPSVDPELMIRMLLVGYCYGIRSERRLCQEVHLNLGYRWFCRLGIETAVPDHSSFSKNRPGRFRDSALFRRLFEDVVVRCMQAGLVSGEGFAIDASVIEADASRGRKVDGKLTGWPETEKMTRPVREYLAALDEAAVETAKTEDVANDMPPGTPPAAPKVTSLTDPAAAWTNKGQTKVGFAYGTTYLIDTRRAIIVDVEATPARWTSEVAATKTMLERTLNRFGLKPQRLAADAAYGSGLMIGWLMRHQIEPHIPLLDREHQTNGFFTRANFPFDPQVNVFVCPEGKQLKSTGLVREDGTVPYLASTKDCRACALKPRCTNGKKRIVTRNLFEAEREHVRALKGTEAFERSARERRKIEMLFAHLKRNLNFRRLRLRGITGASDEFLLAATVQNLKKLVRFMGDRPPIPTACPA
jgi:transposase